MNQKERFEAFYADQHGVEIATMTQYRMGDTYRLPGIAAHYRTFKAAEGGVVDRRDSIRDAVAAAIGEAMDCTRVWSAWDVGTMSQDDFQMVAEDDERLEEIVDAIINAMKEDASAGSAKG